MTDQTRSLPRLFAELKRRKVFRVMAVYGATAFVVLQAADLLAEGMGLSDQVLRVSTFLVLVGFPIAVVLAWAFESTPGGIRRTADATPEEIDAILAQPARRRWPAGLLALAGVALLAGGWWMGRQGHPGPELKLAVSEAHAAEFPYVAVLPFDDLGGNAENDPFLSGMHMAVQDKLEGLASLRVTSTESVRGYTDAQKSARDIAAELGNVSFVLRGSVGRSGNQARVTAWLIDATTNERIWFDQWDRELTAENLFAIQSGIAVAIADRLEADLTPGERERLEAGQSTSDLEAINLYYRAQNALDYGQSEETWRDALAYAEQAVARAPGYVEAWTLVSELRSLAELAGENPGSALEAVERAEALAPGSATALRARAGHTIMIEQDYRGGLELLEEAARLAPSDADVLEWLAYSRHYFGDYDDGLRAMARAVALDPRNPERLVWLAQLLSGTGRWKAAHAVVERALALDPGDGLARAWKVVTLHALHRDPERTRRAVAEIDPNVDAPVVAFTLVGIALDARDYEWAASLLENVEWDHPFVSAVRLSSAEYVARLRGVDPVPFADSLIALVDSIPTLQDSFEDYAATARYLEGDADGGAALLRQRVDEARASGAVTDLVFSYWQVATVYARFGQQEEALAALERAVARPLVPGAPFGLASLELSPLWDGLRDDPRFQELIDRQAAYEREQARLAEAAGPWLP